MMEFAIDRMSDANAVIGRCLRGPIRVGDAFSSIYRIVDGRSRNPSRADITPVLLRVDQIDAYQRSWTTLDEGLTAKITLSGDGLAALSPGHVLGA